HCPVPFPPLPCSVCCPAPPPAPHSSPTRRSSDLGRGFRPPSAARHANDTRRCATCRRNAGRSCASAGTNTSSFPRKSVASCANRSEEHTSELQSRENLVCRLLLEKKKKNAGTSKK